MGQFFDSQTLKLLHLNIREDKIKVLQKSYIGTSRNILGTEVFSHTYKFSDRLYNKFWGCFVLFRFVVILMCVQY